jgi:Trk-type K+ transport system membrane component
MTLRTALSAERGSSKVGETKEIIKVSVIAIYLTIIISSIVLGFYFYYVPGKFAETPK